MSGWHAKTGRRGFEDAVSSCAVICMGAAKDQWAAPPPHGTRQPVGLVLPWASHLVHPTDGAPGDLRQEQVAGLKTASLLDRVHLTRLGSPPLCRAYWSRQSASHDRGPLVERRSSTPRGARMEPCWPAFEMRAASPDRSSTNGPRRMRSGLPSTQGTDRTTIGTSVPSRRSPGAETPCWPEERLTWRAPPTVAGSGRACGANGARSTS